MIGNTAQRQKISTSTSPKLLRLCVCLVASAMLLGGCASQRERLSNSIGKRINLEVPDNHPSFINRWYAGVALGNSRLDPDLSDVGFSLQQGNAVGTQMRLGYDVHNLLSVEFDTSVLGAAEFESTAEVEYTSLSASGLIYGLTGNSNRSRRQDWSAFARVGYSYSTAASNVQVLDGRDLSGAILGLGVEYGMANGVGLRMEATRFHDEAMLVGLGAVYRFGSKERGRPTLFAKKKKIEDSADYTIGENGSFQGSTPRKLREPALQAGLPGVLQQGENPATEVTLTPRVPASRTQEYLRKVVVATVKDLDGDGVSNEADECANTRAGTSVDSQGCGLFDGVVEGVTFENGSAGLNSTSKKILDRVATRLMAFPEVRVEVQAHTDDKGPEYINQSVSESRADAVVRYLIRHGVSAEQLKPVGLGETRPRSDDADEYGRLANRRIELLTLPDLDIVPRHVTVITPAVAQQSINGSAAGAIASLSSAKKAVARKSGELSAKQASSRKATVQPAEPSLAAAKEKRTPVEFLPSPVELPGFELNGVLEGVGFDGRTDSLKVSSESALQKVVSGLEAHPSARIAIMVHTDNQGEEEENLDLTARQAAAVSDWLAQKGIDKKRMEIEGYGESLPVVQNISESDRKRNRRVELRVLSR